ncbi:MAG: tRNA (cytidine(34)-2'-O)-methyltransferase [Antricoccus sp.]
MMRIVFWEPEIPPNTGNAIRLAACVPAELHLIEPLGFDLSDKQLRRAGLDYHDLAVVAVHPDLETALASFGDCRVFAFTRKATTLFTDISYGPGDVLLFGRESVGLSDEVLARPDITDRLRIPMLPARRSLNVANAASIAAYEVWRQFGFAGS